MCVRVWFSLSKQENHFYSSQKQNFSSNGAFDYLDKIYSWRTITVNRNCKKCFLKSFDNVPREWWIFRKHSGGVSELGSISHSKCQSRDWNTADSLQRLCPLPLHNSIYTGNPDSERRHTGRSSFPSLLLRGNHYFWIPVCLSKKCICLILIGVYSSICLHRSVCHLLSSLSIRWESQNA